MTAETEVRTVIVNWAKAVSDGDRKVIMAHHVDDLLMFDFTNICRRLGCLRENLGFFRRFSAGAGDVPPVRHASTP